MWGVDKADFRWKDATRRFTTDVAPEAVAAGWEFREDLSAFTPTKYRGQLMPPVAVSTIQISNDGLGDMSLQAGAWISLRDYVENHVLPFRRLSVRTTATSGSTPFRGGTRRSRLPECGMNPR